MITHRYIKPEDNPAQHAADKLGLQEITWAFREIHKCFDLLLWEWDPEQEDNWRERRKKWPNKPNLRMFVKRDQLREKNMPIGEIGEGKIQLFPDFAFWVIAAGNGCLPEGTKLGIVYARYAGDAREQLRESGQLGPTWPDNLKYERKD